MTHVSREDDAETALSPAGAQPEIDVVVVSYNSRDHLRACVEQLAGAGGFTVIVVDNASTDGSVDALAGLPVTILALSSNGGFAHGCNVGWRRGRSPFVLFLNPDAAIDPASVRRLAGVLERDHRVSVAAPKIVNADGALDYSLRRFSRVRSTFARALFLHRLFPRAAWADEIVRHGEVYESAGSADWVSGACMLIRRSALEQLDGFDEGFFMYCEDQDICRRVWNAGEQVRYEPSATCIHEGGASAPRAALLPTLARSRVRYATLHHGRLLATFERVGLALEALIRVVVTPRGFAARSGHAHAIIGAAGYSARGSDEAASRS